MAKNPLENKGLVKRFYEALEKIPAPKPIQTSSINGAFKEYLNYLFDVAQRMEVFFLSKSFDPAMAATNVDRLTIDNLRFWSRMARKTPEAAMEEIYFGDKRISYLKELLSVKDPETAINYVETAFNIKSRTKNPAELAAGICNDMAEYIYSNVTKAKKDLGEYLKEPEKRSFFDFFKGRQKS